MVVGLGLGSLVGLGLGLSVRLLRRLQPTPYPGKGLYRPFIAAKYSRIASRIFSTASRPLGPAPRQCRATDGIPLLGFMQHDRITQTHAHIVTSNTQKSP